ncbi:putative bifunctional diguanylate cyclase/phosphodiesterase [Anoxybacteroides tepidamans]|uniref:putative bifunctional diguanylate cyclase/phosphodiesterase n=1 Tax=Anoxybacteroides tepidamans TaxID=265948 RepID=UPI000480889F|nr:bifunctional diguanylate cyclase/phosphodiesterase [Anoxybacillus tepidamans]
MLSNTIEYTLFILIILLIILTVQHQMNRLIQTKLEMSIFQMAQRLTIIFYIFIFFMLIGGFWYINYLEEKEHKEYEQFSKHFTSVLASELLRMDHYLLNSSTSESNDHYVRILRSMTRWQNENREILSIYTIKKQKDGKNYFVIAPATDYNRNGKIDGQKEQIVPIGTVYKKHIPELERAFQGYFSMEPKPASDYWGETISAFGPIFNPDGKVDAVLGVDYDVKKYNGKIEKARNKGIATVFLLFLITYILYLLLIYIRLEKLLFKKYKAELEISQQRFKRLSEVSVEGIIIHSEGVVLEANKAACELFGYTADEFFHMPIQTLVAPSSLHDLRASLAKDNVYEMYLKKKDGTIFPAEILRSEYEYYSKKFNVTAIRDITERKKHEERMHYIAFHDDLTGLPNKEMLHRLLTEKMDEANRVDSKVAVMFVEMKGLKIVNDLCGYSVGDQVLLAAVAKIKSAIGEADVFGRWSGNEFVLILPHIEKEEQVKELSHRLTEMMEEPLLVNGQEFFMTLKMGISIYPKDGDDSKTLIRKADIARHELSKKAISQFRFFEKQMNRTIYEKINVERELRKALEAEEFELYYQPQIQLSTGQVVGMEALIRWNHPERGMISPNTFIPIAEETGLIIPINEWVMERACQQTKQLLEKHPSLSVSVNLSPYEFESRRLVHKLVKILEKTNLPPHCLDIEITERMTMDTEKAIPILNSLKSVGINVSIDDFGTGYSSLSYLKKLPIDRLKIDRSFVQNIQEEKEAILPAIISLGHNIGVKVLAEGVETEQEASYLREKQCDEVQGYYYTKPLPFGDLVKFLEEHQYKRHLATSNPSR